MNLSAFVCIHSPHSDQSPSDCYIKSKEVAGSLSPVSHTALLNLLYKYPQLSPVFTSEPNNTKPKASTWRFEELKYFHMATLFMKKKKEIRLRANYKLAAMVHFFKS